MTRPPARVSHFAAYPAWATYGFFACRGGDRLSGKDSGLRPLQAQQRLLARCLFQFVLDEAGRLAREHDGDLVRGVVQIAIVQATRSLDGVDPDGPGAPPRAVSVRAIGQSLGLPYETTRRKVVELEEKGLCRRVSGSGVAAAPAPRDQAFLIACDASWRSLRSAIAGLNAISFDYGMLEDVSAQAGPPRGLPLPEAVASLSQAFLLRVLESAAAPHGSIPDAAIVTAMLIANAETMARDPEMARKYAGAGTPPPDSLRRPATVAEIAARLGMTRETVRRRANRYVKLGWAVRVAGGYLFSMERQQEPEVLQTGLASAHRFLQLLQAVRQLGVDLTKVEPA